MSFALVKILPVTFATTGIWASHTWILSNSSFKRRAAGSIKRLWNGALTGSITARFAPASFIFSAAVSTAAVSPAITICPGQLKLTACTEPTEAFTSSQISTTRSRGNAKIAAIAPLPNGTASCIYSPRL